MKRRIKRPKSADVSAPLVIGLVPPKVSDIPAGASITPGCLLLHISTLPVFGAEKNETRYYNFPVDLPPPYNTPNQENALLAFHLMRATSPIVHQAVEELLVLARTPASRAYARQHPEMIAK